MKTNVHAAVTKRYSSCALWLNLKFGKISEPAYKISLLDFNCHLGDTFIEMALREAALGHVFSELECPQLEHELAFTKHKDIASANQQLRMKALLQQAWLLWRCALVVPATLPFRDQCVFASEAIFSDLRTMVCRYTDKRMIAIARAFDLSNTDRDDIHLTVSAYAALLHGFRERARVEAWNKGRPVGKNYRHYADLARVSKIHLRRAQAVRDQILAEKAAAAKLAVQNDRAA